MALINHNIYRQKYQIFVHFQFSCTNFDGHLKRQSFKTSRYTQNESNIEHCQKVLFQAEHAKRRSDILIDKAISILFCRSSGCVPL